MVTERAEPTDVERRVWSLLETVTDPEIPVLSVCDLGIVRAVEVTAAGVAVTITPTYSGCPAMGVIALDIRRALGAAGLVTVEVRTALAPAWTSDWLARRAARSFARSASRRPRSPRRGSGRFSGQVRNVACPRCGSTETELVSAFGSTACKALYSCRLCLEPFDYFKCI